MKKFINRNILNKKVTLNLIVFCLIIFFLSIVSSLRFKPDYKTKYIDDNAITLSDNWNLKTLHNNTKTIVNFPMNLKYHHNNTYSFSKVLTEDLDENFDTLCLRIGFSNVNVFLDNNLIYTSNFGDYEKLSNKGSNTIYMIPLGGNLKDKELKFVVEMKSNFSLPYDIKTPIIGTKTSIIHNLISSQVLNYVIIFLLITFTLSIFVISGIAFYKSHKNIFHLLYIGIFALLSSIYAISETNIMQILIPNTYLLNNLTFMSLMLVGIPIVMIMIETTNKKYTKPLLITTYSMIINFIMQSLLTLLGILDLRSMLVISHILIMLNGILSLYIMILSWHDRSFSSKCFTISIVPMIIGTSIDIVLFYVHIPHYYGILFQAGVLIFIVIQLWYVINKYFHYYKLSIKSNVYEKMAFTDTITELENRAAFEKKITFIDNNITDFSSIWCISMDLNNLKFVNDNLGHDSGDTVIISFAKILKDTFNSIGSSYRTGGDEFIVIVKDISQSSLENKITDLYNSINKFNLNSNLKISVALGYDNFKINEDNKITDLLTRADKLMYIDKRETKKILYNKYLF
ncbi:GGDEF domain-containing protein [Clostridium sp. ZBS2]|uniref:sensor domain-containing diguanylate cyclase n=1 Tax=Clostridium sp. ZBS2 TaxID=2949976 RepID=UPI002079A006|nr:GGDEF domain-containing protein [Clostridium sp. ZBS2]